MPLSHLLKAGGQTRALDALVSGLDHAGVIEQVVEDLDAMTGRSVRVPGFDVFSRSGSMPPFMWLFPKPEGGEEQFLYGYEAFADRPHGQVRAPGTMAAHIYARSRVGRATFASSKLSSHWWTPALTLAAVAQHFSEGAPLVEGDEWSTHVGPGYVKVSPRGVWSNFRNALVCCARPPGDFPAESLRFPDLTSDSSLARAVMRRSEDMDMGVLWSLNAVLRALEGYTLDPALVRSGLLARCESYSGRVTSISRAMAAAEEILQSSDDHVVEKLKEAVVPQILGSYQFKQIFGLPGSAPHRKVSRSTRHRWREYLVQAASGAQLAE